MKIFYLNRNGFMLTEMLIALLITTILLPISITCISLCKEGLAFETDKQDSIALLQLRRILSLSSDFKVNSDSLTFTYHQDEMTLCRINGNILLKPGTQFYFMNVDEIEFFENDGCIYTTYSRNENETTNLLTCI